MFTERFTARVKAVKLKTREQRSVCDVTLETSLLESQIEDLGTEVHTMLFGAGGDGASATLPFAKTELLTRFNDQQVTLHAAEDPDGDPIQIANADVSKITFIRSDDQAEAPLMRFNISSRWRDPHLLFLAHHLGCEVDVEIIDPQMSLFEDEDGGDSEGDDDEV